MNSSTKFLKIKLAFTKEKITGFAGMLPILLFFQKIQLRKKFRPLDCFKASNSIYPLSFILEYLIVGWLASSQRLSHFQTIEHDPLFIQYFGKKGPHHSLLNKDYQRMADYRMDVYFRMILMDTAAPLLPSEIILDLDSTVETVYGDQEGAAVGMNAIKPGRKSYHPLVATEGKSKVCLNAVLRPGNDHTSKDAKDFIEDTLNRLPSEVTLKYMRFDKGFAGEEFYSYIEGKQIGYTGKLKLTPRIQKKLQNCNWTRIAQEDGWIIEETEFIYQATSWVKPRRVVAIRKTEAEPWEGDQMCFAELEWKTEVIVTNLDWNPYDIWRFYNKRACMENYIKEAKHGFAIDHIPTKDFKANEIDLLLKWIAYNLFEHFKQTVCDTAHKGYTINRFRREFIVIPGTLSKHARHITLNLSRYCLHQLSRVRMQERVLQLE